MKSIAKPLFAYGAFLILCGLVGYLSNPEKAQTALFSGGTFGMLNIGLGWLALRGWGGAHRSAIGLACFLGAVFVWRTTVTWMAVADGNDEKRVAGMIISTMLGGTLVLIVYLIRARERNRANAA